ncbi:DUF6056 family protein [Streptomyces sp. NPDC020875]|uniref:DUF6056 family protein n=1 Tax=Streptomyces sp. NPDC020875 TaxID=3154898 RepID=UPI0033D60AC6
MTAHTGTPAPAAAPRTGPDSPPDTAPDTGPPPPGRRPFAARWPLALAALPLGLLALAFWFGRYVRPGADEWCFLPRVRDDGMWGLVHTFWATDNGRIANGLLVGAYAEFPVAGHQWYGPVSGALILLLLWATAAAAIRRAGLVVPRGMPLLIAATAVAALLFATPNTYKTFYWPAASVSHTLAPALAAGAAVPLLRARTRRGLAGALAVAGLAGAFVGTLSEETSVVVLVVLGATLLCAGPLLTEPYRRPVRLWALTGAAGVAAGTLILVTSPGSRNRRGRYDAESVSMLAPESLLGAARGFAEILGTTLTTWPYLGVIAAGVLLGLTARRAEGAARVFRPVRPAAVPGLCAGAFLLSGYLCTVITYPVFGAAVTTTERTWNDYLPLWVLLLTVTGALLGHRIRTTATGSAPVPGRSGRAAVAAAVICAVTTGALAADLTDLGHDMRIRADRWDRQDTYLRAGAARGETVMPYTPTRVSRMLEPFARDGRRPWPATCVADYYHLDRVTYARTFQGP